MTTKYRDTSGIKVRNTASDLPANANFRGEIYYNSTEGKFKFVKENFTPSGNIANSTWSSKTNYPTTAEFLGWGFGKKDSLFVGGHSSPWSAGYTWDGSSWASATGMSTGRYQTGGGFGADSEDGLIGRGRKGSFTPSNFVNLTERWDGSAWSELAETNNSSGSTRGAMGQGSPSGMIVGTDGSSYSPRAQSHVEVWDGSSWSEVSEFSPADTSTSSGFGSATSAVQIGDTNDESQSWDGSSWSSITDPSNQRETNASQGKDAEDGAITGGYSGSSYLGVVEGWNGSAWSEYADMTEARSNHKHDSNNPASETLLVTGYDGGSQVNSVEEFASPSTGSFATHIITSA